MDTALDSPWDAPTRDAPAAVPVSPVGLAALPPTPLPVSWLPVAPHGTYGRRVGRLIKHGLDRSLAGLALLMLLPLLLGLALLVRVTSHGPALYKQERVGRDGRTFTMWKFRSMALGADEELAALLRQHDRHLIPLFKIPNDPRVTRLGALLRRTSLDELPQLYNVLRGEMSLVGPRPQRPAEVALYAPEHRLRLSVRPGLTGMWQVNGRSDLPWQEALEHDLRYVRGWSLALDARILVRTVGVVLSGRGAE